MVMTFKLLHNPVLMIYLQIGVMFSTQLITHTDDRVRFSDKSLNITSSEGASSHDEFSSTVPTISEGDYEIHNDVKAVSEVDSKDDDTCMFIK